MKLQELLSGVQVSAQNADGALEITGVSYDSRTTRPGDLFVAVSGYATDGHKFIPMALQRGAAAVLFSRLVTRPLTTLQSASEKIAAGQYTERTQVQTNDEIGTLSRSFDRMAAAVEGKIDEMGAVMQSQQDFIAAFTHEVKTPMTAMLGYADLMRAAPDDADLQRESANYIYHETRRLEEPSVWKR